MKKGLALLLVLVLSFTLMTGCGKDADTSEVYTLKWAHVSPEDNDKQSDNIKKLIERCNEESDGRLKIELHGNSVLGTEEESFEGIQMGTIEMGSLSTAAVSGFYPGILATSIPYLFKNREEAWDLFDSETGDWLAEQLEAATNVKVLGWGENGLRCFTTTDRQIKTAADVKGLQIRTQSNAVIMDMVTALGGTPQVIAFGELYTALSQGTVDGQENPPGLIYTQGLYEVQPYLTLDYHTYDLAAVYINPGVYNGLPDDLRAILDKNIEIYVDEERASSAAEDEANIQAMKDAGVSVYELSDAEYQTFVDATASVLDTVRKEAGSETVDMVLQGVENLRK